MATYGELIAHRLQTVEAVGAAVGADSLGYLSLDGAFRAVGLRPEGLCTACFSGDYPLPVQLELESVSPKLRLESPRGLDVDRPLPTEFDDAFPALALPAPGQRGNVFGEDILLPEVRPH